MKTIETFDPFKTQFLDAFGNEIHIGDTVVLTQYEVFYKATVENFTESGRVNVFGFFSNSIPMMLTKLPNKLIVYKK